MVLKYTASVLNSIGYRFISLGKKIYQKPKTLFDNAIAKWFADKGDQTLRLNYDLSSDAVVFDLGGFEGQWASDIFSRYCCSIYVFELFDEYAKAISLRFGKNPMYNYGYDSDPFGLTDVSKMKITFFQLQAKVIISFYREGYELKKMFRFNPKWHLSFYSFIYFILSVYSVKCYN
jgi:hypothetical protein